MLDMGSAQPMMLFRASSIEPGLRCFNLRIHENDFSMLPRYPHLRLKTIKCGYVAVICTFSLTPRNLLP